MEWRYYALFAIVLIACAFGVRAHLQKRNARADQELNRRIDERVDRLNLTRRDKES